MCPQISEIEGNSGDPIWPEGGSGGWVDPAYDAAGNMTEGPKPGYEASADKRQFYVWDAWNRLVEVWEDTNGDGDKDAQGTDTQVLTCRYDGLGRRIQKIVEGTPDVTYDYYYNESWQVLEVRKDADTDPYEQYVWDIRYIDAPVLRDRDTSSPPNGTIDETLYYCNDANMNVTALVNTSGTVVERYVYDPYGRATVYSDDWSTEVTTWANSKQNSIRYCGYRFDPETGLYHVRHRYYDPPLGRWLSRDPRGYADGMHLGAYVRSSPVVFFDPSGLGLWDDVVAGVEDFGDALKFVYSQMTNDHPVCKGHGSQCPVQEYEGTHPPNDKEQFGLGWEFFTGTAPLSQSFHQNDWLTQQVMSHWSITERRGIVINTLKQKCRYPACDETGFYSPLKEYSLGTFKGTISAYHDHQAAFTDDLANFGLGNEGLGFIGSYAVEAWTDRVDCCAGAARIRWHVWNMTTLESATRPPGIGYTSLDKPRGWACDVLDSFGPFRATCQHIYWEEEVQFDGDARCSGVGGGGGA